MGGKKTTKGFSVEEREAMQARFKELNAKKSDGEKMVLEKINAMKGDDKAMAKKLHELIKKAAPELSPKTWYGMPAYANSQGQVICFFQNAGRFKARYSTFGFSDKAKLDEGNFWPTSFALSKLTPVEEKKIVELIKKAVD